MNPNNILRQHSIPLSDCFVSKPNVPVDHDDEAYDCKTMLFTS